MKAKENKLRVERNNRASDEYMLKRMKMIKMSLAREGKKNDTLDKMIIESENKKMVKLIQDSV